MRKYHSFIARINKTFVEDGKSATKDPNGLEVLNQSQRKPTEENKREMRQAVSCAAETPLKNQNQTRASVASSPCTCPGYLRHVDCSAPSSELAASSPRSPSLPLIQASVQSKCRSKRFTAQPVCIEISSNTNHWSKWTLDLPLLND